ncbi:WD40 repeat-like protein [Anaeromyces robustus]|uniref:WD40 repeat-like protein n=1 Tax=Anaeromyces robustus TaxID=1754192 RepID=A0A1Y1XER7_9FUNG|nr:WD40 repeat-like protein [Anaeromyces robustus]|eukprot:ORX84248.1 WD40 repeat-like protein [Anaeromyces robustus]
MDSKLYYPFRKLGQVTNDVPFIIQNRGQQFFITTCVGNSFQIYDCEKMHLLFVGTKTEKPISSIAAYSNYTFAASGSDIIIYKRAKEVGKLNNDISGRINSLLTFGSQLLIALYNDNLIQIWNHFTQELYTSLEFNDSFKVTTILHPSTYLNKILLGSTQGSMQLWNIRTKKLIYQFKSFGSPITCLVQSPAIDTVAIGLLNGKIILYNIKYDEEIFQVQQEGKVTSITFRTDEEAVMATANSTGDIALWDLLDQRIIHVMKGAHNGSISSIQFLNYQALLISSGSDNSVKQWLFDSSDGLPRLLKFRNGHHSPPTYIRYYDNKGRMIISAGKDRSLRLFSTIRDSQNTEFSQGKKKKENSYVIDDLKLRQINQFDLIEKRGKDWDNIITSHMNDNQAKLWSFQRKAIGNHILPTKDKSAVKCVAMSYCGNYGFLGSANGNIDVYNVQSGILRKSFKAHSKVVSSIALDIYNKYIISSSLDGTIKIHDFKTTKLIKEFTFESSVTRLLLHHSTNLLAAVSDDLCIRLFDIETQKHVREFWGHENRISDLAFSPDGRWLISSSYDCTIRTWDIPTGNLIDILELTSPVTSISFSPTGDFLASTQGDSVGISLWSNRSQYMDISFFSMNNGIISSIDINEIENGKNDESLISLSSVNNSQCKTLLNLAQIKKRNKPKEAPKAPEKAPFFLPTISGAIPKFDASKDKEEKSEKPIKETLDLRTGSEFIDILKNCTLNKNYEPFIEHVKSLSPSAIDFELRCLNVENDMYEFKCLLEGLEYCLKEHKNFELVEACLNVLLKIHNSLIIENYDIIGPYIERVNQEHEKVWQTMEELFQYGLCVTDFAKLQ